MVTICRSTWIVSHNREHNIRSVLFLTKIVDAAITFCINRRCRLAHPFISHKPLKRKHLEMVEEEKKMEVFQCQDCDRTFLHRKGLNIHRRSHERKSLKEQSCGETFLQGADFIPPKYKTMNAELPSMKKEVTPSESIRDYLLARYASSSNSNVKKGRKLFITDQRFDRMLGDKESVKWKQLSYDCIYKMDFLYRFDEDKISAHLSNRDGVVHSVILPEFVIKELLKQEQIKDATVYLKRKEDDQVSIVTLKTKHVCEICNVGFGSASNLSRHQRKCCK